MEEVVKEDRSKKKLIIALAIFVIAGASIVGVSLTRTKKVAPAEAPKVVTYSTDKPDESKIDKNTYKWTGAAADPKYIDIPAIGVGGFIQAVGVDQDNRVAVPTNINLTGWFVDTVRPGDIGLSVIDGHVDGLTTDGIFSRLKELKKDQIVSIEFGSGQKKSFKVIEVQTLDTKGSEAVLFSQKAGVSRQVNLVTCGGTFDETAKSYDKRVIVSAEAM
mgnify:CR=1 FL=1